MQEEKLELTQEWDKVFPQSDQLDMIPFDDIERFYREYLGE